MDLRTKFILVLLFVTLILGGGVFTGFNHLRAQSIDRAQTSVNETAALTAAQIDARLGQVKEQVSYAAAQPAAADFGDSAPYLHAFLSGSQFTSARVVAANGTVMRYRETAMATESQETRRGVDHSNRTYVRTALNGETYITPVTCDGYCTITISTPVFEDGNVTGVFAATLPLVNAQLFAPTDPLRTETQTIRVTAATTDGRIVLAETHRTFERTISATRTVETTGWQVTVIRSRAALNEELRSLLYIEGASLLIVLGAVLVLGGWEHRTNLQQTERLLEGFEAVRRGEYDHSLSLSSAEEWRQVSDGFNELTDGIQEREERLQILNRVLRHNLRNKLTIVTGHAQKLPEYADDPQIEQSSERILDASQTLQTLADNAREMEEAMAESASARTDVEVPQTLREILTDLREAYPEIDVQTDLPDELVASAPPGAEFALRQVCKNAFEHNTSEDPLVEVSAERVTREDGDYASILIRDNGPGIPEQDLDSLTTGEETPLKHGSGMGLWFVQWLVQRSDGSLEIESTELPMMSGTTVTIEFPVED